MVFRAFWTIAVLAAAGFLLYVVVVNAIRLSKHEKAVSVEVTSDSELQFPGITICNQNQFRCVDPEPFCTTRKRKFM